MKRKYFSALLMGALTVASMSTFTSCKDYDDDISNLQGQIDKLATADQLSQKVAELQALISSNTSSIGTLQSALDEAKKAAEKAQTTADSKATLDQVYGILGDYAKVSYVDGAKKSLNDAIEALKTGDIAQLKKDVEAAKLAADKAKTDAMAAIEEVKNDLTNKFEAKLETEKTLREAAIAALETNKADKTALDKAIEKLEEADRAAKVEILGKLEECITSADAQTKINKAIEDLKKGDIKDINTKLDAVKTTAENALAQADKAESEKGKAYLKAVDAADAATAAARDAALAQAKADANETAVNNINDLLGTGFSATNTVKAAIELINTQLTNDKTGLAALDGRLSSIESLLNQDTPDATSLKTRVDNIENKLKDIIGQYSTMVTDVQLFKFAAPNADRTGYNNTLNFIQAAEQKNTFPKDAKVAGKQLTFEDGKYYVGDDSLIVRVSPVDAELTASNVSLINSQGKELNGIVDVTSVSRYNDLLTRSNSGNSGLWVVKFKATEMGDKFAEAEMADVNGRPKKILYAVAVKNTYNTTGEEKDEATRRVTSEFDVDLASGVAKHVWDFDVNGTSVAEIHNRYKSCENGATSTTSVKELVWKMKRDERYNNYYVTATDAIETGDHVNVVNRPTEPVNGITYTDAEKDNRQDMPILAVAQGQPITIDFSNNIETGVKGFYVTLDEHYALESAPSELNAWNSYTYKGVGYKNVPATLFEGGKGEITIVNTGNVQGDVIGFRVYAVNYDGTLTDPDGRSFYVAVGDVQGVKDLGNSDLTLNGDASTSKFESTVALSADLSNLDFDDFTGWKITAADASGTIPTQFAVEYYGKDGEKLDIPKPSKDVKSIKFILEDPQSFIDGATYNVTGTLTKKISTATSNVCVLNASFTKVMPTAAPTFCYRDGYSKTPEYIIPEGGNYTVGSDNKGGSFKLNNLLIIDNNNTWKGDDLFDEASTAGKFSFNVSNGTYDAEKKNVVSAKAEAPYVLSVVNGKNNLVDNKTERTIAANYIYYDISKQYNKETKQYELVHEYPVPSASSAKIVYCSWMKTLAVKTALKSTWTGTKGDGDGKNVVTWMANGKGGATLDLANLQTEISDLKLLPAGALIADGKSFGGLIDKNVVEVVKVKYDKVYTTDKTNTQVNPHFSAEFDGSKIVLTQRAESTVAPSTTAGNIHFTVKDCFGNTKEIVLPFYIKK